MSRLAVHALGGPTAILALGGLRLLTDPTFDPPGVYPIGARALTKTAGPASGPDAVGRIDAVLLSHDQHPDNLDKAGRAFLAEVPVVLTTQSGAARLGGNAKALANWATTHLARPDGGVLQVTGLPAQHGPDGSEHLTGEVTGFWLSGDGLPTVYVSGDNASVEVVRTIRERLGSPDVAILFAGAARTALAGGAPLTLTSADAAEATRVLGARHAVPLHLDGWQHYREGPAALQAAFAQSRLTDRLILLPPGAHTTL